MTPSSFKANTRTRKGDSVVLTKGTLVHTGDGWTGTIAYTYRHDGGFCYITLAGSPTGARVRYPLDSLTEIDAGQVWRSPDAGPVAVTAVDCAGETVYVRPCGATGPQTAVPLADFGAMALLDPGAPEATAIRCASQDEDPDGVALFGIRIPGGEDGGPYAEDVTTDREECRERLERYRQGHPDAQMVAAYVRAVDWYPVA